MKRLSFILFTFPLTVVTLMLAWLTLTEGGLNWIYLQLRDQPSFNLDAERVEGRLIGPIRVSELWLEVDDLSLQIESLKVEYSLWSLVFSRVDIHDLQLDDVQLILPPASDGAPIDPAGIAIKLPLRRITLDRLALSGLRVSQGDNEVPVDRLSAVLDLDGQSLKVAEFEVESFGHRLSLRGDVALTEGIPLDLKLQWRANLPGQPVASGGGRVHGDLNRLRLLQSVKAPTRIDLDAEVLSPLSDLHWDADVQVHDFRSLQWQLPGMEFSGQTSFSARGTLDSVRLKGSLQGAQDSTGPLAADFDLEWSRAQRLEIHDLQLASKQSDSRLGARGWWRPGNDGGEIDVAMEWKALRWPLHADQDVFSPSGAGHIRGGIDDYRFSFNTTSPLAQLPDANLTAVGRGQQKGVHFETVRLSALQGWIEAKGDLSWPDALMWRGQVQGSGINPQALLPDWPGRLDFSFSQGVEYRDGQWWGEAEIEQAEGELRGYPVGLSGRFEWRDQALNISQAVFKSGDSRVQASGTVNDQLALQWSVDSPRLEELYPALQGQLSAHGDLSGQRAQPRVSASMQASKLVYQDYRVERLEGKFEVDVLDPLGVSGDLRLGNLVLAGQRLDDLHLSGDSSSLKIKLRAADYGLDAALAGRLQDDSWQGRLLKSDITAGPFKTWRMQAPARLTLDREQRVKLERACWGNDDQAGLCVVFNGGRQQWLSELSLSDFPIQSLKPWLPAGIDVQTAAGGEAKVRFAGGRLSGQAGIRLSAGKISYPLQDDEPESIQHQGGSVDLVAAGDGVSASMQLDLGDNDELRGEIKLPGANLLAFDSASQRLQGALNVRLHQLAFLGQQVPEVNQLSGRAGLNVKLSGLMRRPSFEGSLSLDDGKLAIPRLGLTVSELSLRADSNDLDKVGFRLAALSGNGRLTAQGNAWRQENGEWKSEIDIKGNDVEVSRIPEARIEASPALKVVITPFRVDLSGRIDIPYAHIEPRDFTTAARVSSDVVIVGEQQQPERKWQITSRVQLVLGDRVHFNGFGFEGRLNGQVAVEESPGLPTRASGAIGIVDGRYRAYGQRLTIEQGSLLFSGGPLTSPGVDARAVRKVGSITAGVRARGQLQQPVVELFSTPAMGQTDILSYLLLGRPIDNASESDGSMMAQAALALGLSGGDRLARGLRDRFGLDEMRVESNDTGDQASLVIGRYLSPQLYVSYGIGLVEAFNTLMVRYSISESWQLKAESGEAHGADLIYTIER